MTQTDQTQTDQTQTQTQTQDEIPYFPAQAPAVFSDGRAVRAMFTPVLESLGQVVDLPDSDLAGPTPCASYTVEQLRDHVLGWLQHFAAALGDPDRRHERADADAYRARTDPREPAEIVQGASADISVAVDAGIAGRRVVMSQATMDGDAVLAMALGEYVLHGWDLARATGREWQVPEPAAASALEFFSDLITDEYRSQDGGGGFFGARVEVADDAPALDRLLGFAGRDPSWVRQD